jgi:broad specificity phosphatase PhoE
MARVLLVRHGESVANALRIWQGHADYPLSERGITEARAVAAALANRPIAAIWASPLKRAAHTAGAIAESLGLSTLHDQRLMEVDVGAASGLTSDEVHARFPQRAESLARGVRWTFPGQEHPEAFHDRIHQTLGALLALDGDIVAVTHGGVIGHLAADILGIGHDNVWPFSIENCSITEIVTNRQGRLALARLNDTCHLVGLTIE